MNQTVFFIFKAVISGLLIALISTLAKGYPKWAALLTALPLMTFLSLIWIYLENKNLEMLAQYTWDVFIWVIPSLLFFVAAYFLFKKQIPFVWAMSLSTIILFLGVFIFEKLGILK